MPDGPAKSPQARTDLDGRLVGTRFGPVWWFTSIDSTNRMLLAEARDGGAEGLVTVADHQTSGRGRLGRRWEAPAGSSLLVSVLLRPALAPARRHAVVVAAALAMAEAVEATTGVAAALKWPNDLLAGDRKLGGVLAEAEGDAVVVGLGINVDWPGVPPELAGIATACNLEGGRPVERADLLVAFLERYEYRLRDLDGALAAYRERLGTLGRRVRVERATDVLEGTAVALDDAGHLVVETTSGSRETVAAGDVVHVR